MTLKHKVTKISVSYLQRRHHRLETSPWCHRWDCK